MAEDETEERLRSGEAFADLSHWRQVEASGADARAWLDDLVTADLSDLAPGRARHALFLAPTGGVRASFTVTVPSGGLVLIQDPSQPNAIHELLEPYILSSDVRLHDRTGTFAVFAFPGRTEVPVVPGTVMSAPSCLGAGVDLMASAEDHESLLGSLRESFGYAADEEVESWRVAAGIPRFGVDAVEGDLPQESGLMGAVSRDKGCFPGQEAVAKVDTLGHPRRLVLSFEADGPVTPGDPVMLDGSEVGEITSTAEVEGRMLLLARLRWEARDGRLRTGLGTALSLRRQVA